MCTADPKGNLIICAEAAAAVGEFEQQRAVYTALDLADAAMHHEVADLHRTVTPLGELQWIDAHQRGGERRRSWGRIGGGELADDELGWLLDRYGVDGTLVASCITPAGAVVDG